MKKIYLTLLSCFIAILTMSQTPGFSYQAVILNPDVQSLPGNDVEQGLLSESDIAIRFTIENEFGTEYQETHTTKTDAYGMVSLMVGQGMATIGNFTEVAWVGAEKYLKVEIDFTASGASYESLDRQALTYLPQPLSLESNNRINDLELAINTLAADLTIIELTPGPQGNDGADGEVGASGSDGVDGTNGTNGIDGIDGADGAVGATGPDGVDGTNGTNGSIGATGPAGVDGTNGTNGLPGADGAVGASGADGPQGIQGVPGTNGIDGAQGPIGPTGVQGLAGDTGVAGPQGPAGNDGVGIAQNLELSGDTLRISEGNYIILPQTILLGCTDSTAINYNSLANTDDGSCIAVILGCTNPASFNYDALANTDDGTCIPFLYGCTDSTSANYNALANTDDGSCIVIGSTYQGGIVFWLDGNGGGLIAAPSDHPALLVYGCSGTTTGASGTAVGTGAQNTINIVVACSTPGIAADICTNLIIEGYSGWFLPSKDELNKMWLNIGQGSSLGNVGGFASNYYLSSTESDSSYVWGQNFYSGHPSNNYSKNSTNVVRAVRAF